MSEFDLISDYQLSGDIVVFDDYTPPQYPGLVKAVDEICEKYNYSRIDIKSHDTRGYVVAQKV